LTTGLPRLAVVGAATAILLAATGCFIVHRVNLQQLDRTPVTVRTPVRAHLIDGSTVLFRMGATVTADHVFGTGTGTRFGLTLAESTSVTSVRLSDVLGLETYTREVDPAATFAISTLATIGVIAGTVAIACAADPKCFGSCPTIYADSAGADVLEAEGFSYSIAPLFEMRDVDPLRVAADSNGIVRLQVRNEALETHYINHLELIEVPHAAGDVAVPDTRGAPVALRHLSAPTRMTDRAGRDVRPVLAEHDGDVFQTAPATLDRATAQDHNDWIDLDLPAPDADSVAVFLRLRNSLLTTVLFYDLMLGDRGAGALDYVADDLQRIGPAVDLGRWYVETMGMHIAVQDGNEWREVTRFLDTGPVAWKDLAVLVPVPRGSRTLRIRLSFVADDWRIDQVAVAERWERPRSRTVALTRVVDSDGHVDTTSLASLRAADSRYLQTQPSQRFFALFDVGRASASAPRTFFLASQGYYTEWIRQGWITSAQPRAPFEPGDGAVGEALRRWREGHEALERQFAATRVPVR
jgi:hypothetical protein